MPPKITFHLRAEHPFSHEIKRILLEQVEMALWQLSTPGLDADAAVHEARKCFKRIRGVLRLVRDEIGPQRYAALNGLFRDAGRALSDIRTSAVLDETLEKVHNRYPQRLSSEDVAILLTRLRAHHQALHEQTIPQKRLFSQIIADLQRGRTLIQALPLTGNHFPQKGLQRVYARGRRGLHNCRQQPTVAQLHEWRKREKYLRYHLRLLAPAWPEVLDSVTEELVLLSELLGLDHDLAELHRTLEENPDLSPQDMERGALRAMIAAYRSELEARSFSMGLRLYAEKPGAFVHRVAAYWRVWVSE